MIRFEKPNIPAQFLSESSESFLCLFKLPAARRILRSAAALRLWCRHRVRSCARGFPLDRIALEYASNTRAQKSAPGSNFLRRIGGCRAVEDVPGPRENVGAGAIKKQPPARLRAGGCRKRHAMRKQRWRRIPHPEGRHQRHLPAERFRLASLHMT